MIGLNEPRTAEEALARVRDVRSRLFPETRAVVRLPALPAAVAVPLPEPKPKPEPERIRIDPEQARAYRESFKNLRTPPRRIIARVAEKHGLTPDDLTGPSRVHDVILARWEAILEVRTVYPDRGLIWLGQQFNRDHTTILHALRQVGAAADSAARAAG